MQEQWKKIKDYPYEVSSFGNVRSLDKYQDFPLFSVGNKKGDKVTMTKVFRKGKIMKQTKTTSGYYCVGLFKDKKVKWSLVHRVVAQAFLPKDSKRLHVNHIDSNKNNNNVSNLEWCTPAENLTHARLKGGLKNLSSKNFVNKDRFTDEQVKEIKELKISSKLPNSNIATKYGVTRRSIDKIISGESYSWVK